MSMFDISLFLIKPPFFELLFSYSINPVATEFTGMIPSKSPPPPDDKPLVCKAEELIFNFFIPIKDAGCSPFKILPVDM